jgi:S-adenosylmethionine hydrolase
MESSNVAEKIEGRVVSVTDAGSLVTDITGEQLRDAPRDERVRVQCDEHFTLGLFASDHAEPEMTFVAIINDEQALQLEIVGESASIMLGIRVGDPVVVEWE